VRTEVAAGDPPAHLVEPDHRERRRARPVDAATPVDEQLRRGGPGVREARHAGAGRGREADIYPRRQAHMVVAGGRRLVGVGVASPGPVAARPRGWRRQVADGGEERHVLIGGAPRPAEVRQTEASQRLIMIKVATGRATQRIDALRVGAPLDHTEWDGRAGEGMPVARRPDQGADIAREPGGCGGRGRDANGRGRDANGRGRDANGRGRDGRNAPMGARDSGRSQDVAGDAGGDKQQHGEPTRHRGEAAPVPWMGGARRPRRRACRSTGSVWPLGRAAIHRRSSSFRPRGRPFFVR